MAWYRKSLPLRVAGAALVALAWLCGTWLRGRAVAGPIDGDPGAFVLAAAIFLCGSGGTLLLTLGAHVFDQIDVASPW